MILPLPHPCYMFCQPHSATSGRQVIPSAVLGSFPQWLRTGRLAAQYLLISLPFDVVHSLSHGYHTRGPWAALIRQFIWYGSLVGLLAIKECGPKQCRNFVGYKMLFVTGQTAQRSLLCMDGKAPQVPVGATGF